MAAQFADVHVFDVDKSVVDKFVAEHKGTAYASAADVVSKCDVIITMVPEGRHVRALFDPILSSDLDIKDKLFLECSTIDIETSKAVGDAVTARGGVFVDAPVSGGPAGAEKAKLTIMAGVDATQRGSEMVIDILSHMGKVVPCGGVTMGLVTKLCNNYVSGTIALATSEGFNLAMRLGLDPRVFHEADSPASHDYKPGFKVQLMKKDYGLAREAAKQVGAKLYLGDAGYEVYSKASEDPACVDRDSRVVYRFIGGKEDWQKKQ